MAAKNGGISFTSTRNFLGGFLRELMTEFRKTYIDTLNILFFWS